MQMHEELTWRCNFSPWKKKLLNEKYVYYVSKTTFQYFMHERVRLFYKENKLQTEMLWMSNLGQVTKTDLQWLLWYDNIGAQIIIFIWFLSFFIFCRTRNSEVSSAAHHHNMCCQCELFSAPLVPVQVIYYTLCFFVNAAGMCRYASYKSLPL